MITLPLLLIGACLVQGQDRLRDLAEKHGKFFGSALNYGVLTATSAPDYANYTTMSREQFSLSTAENACKWGATEPSEGHFDFAQCDKVMDIASQYNQKFRVHNLCWGNYNPPWLSQYANETEALKSKLEAHIAAVMRHYKGKRSVLCYDVVNEALSDAPDVTFKDTIWYPAVSNYVDVAFVHAARANPDAVLFYNDYNVEELNHKSDKMYSMVQSMQQRGIPIHGVGLQMHKQINPSPNATSIEANMRRFGALNLTVHITEMDVGLSHPNNVTGAQLQAQAQVYAQVMQACLRVDACRSYEVWGFTDRHSWRSDKKACLYDANYMARPAVHALTKVLQ